MSEAVVLANGFIWADTSSSFVGQMVKTFFEVSAKNGFWADKGLKW